jgi:hypothetical protein
MEYPADAMRLPTDSRDALWDVSGELSKAQVVFIDGAFPRGARG